MPQDTQNLKNKETLIQNPVMPKKVKFLLTAVVIMGVLIVLGLIVVVTTIIKRSGDTEELNLKPDMHQSYENRQREPFGTLSLQMKRGVKILNTQVRQGELILHIRDSEGEALRFINLNTGHVLGEMRFIFTK